MNLDFDLFFTIEGWWNEYIHTYLYTYKIHPNSGSKSKSIKSWYISLHRFILIYIQFISTFICNWSKKTLHGMWWGLYKHIIICKWPKGMLFSIWGIQYSWKSNAAFYKNFLIKKISFLEELQSFSSNKYQKWGLIFI